MVSGEGAIYFSILSMILFTEAILRLGYSLRTPYHYQNYPTSNLITMPENFYPLLIAFFILFTVILIFVLSVDWNQLAKLYRTDEPAPANLSRLEYGLVGMAYYKGSLNVGVTPQGLYLSIFPLFNFGLPPLLIPWSAIRKIEPANQLFTQRFRLYLTKPDVKIVLRKEALEGARKYLAAQGIEWI
ncbi:hypothetical protein [Calothrix sp. PCC 7507]|uniref:hypothetical protein n=1 Tax=Calothrix sp. PCC 7507 TaxID=99598 RepID=UPI00029F352A|nr:hypothetical protein [Calothrix sp. PCC 7507]AFY33233.1 hypothetical protein Cal7507_2817 [Calothrix sp. PCC 7507]